mgnify:CR=1 FL=1
MLGSPLRTATKMTLKEIAEVVDACILPDFVDLNVEIDYVCSSDLISDLLHFSGRHNSLLITGLINTQVVRAAEIADIKAILFVLNKMPDRELVELAKQKKSPYWLQGYQGLQHPVNYIVWV